KDTSMKKVNSNFAGNGANCCSLTLCAYALLILTVRSAAGAGDENFITIDFPGATQTLALGINPRGDIVGAYLNDDGVTHGFLLSGREFTPIDFPSSSFTFARGINPHGDIVGQYGSAGVNHGFLLSRGEFTSIDCPSATGVDAFGINPRGDIVGACAIAGVTHGFLLRGEEF